jgi:carbon monoxide dehydrogenase subunit G
MSAVSESVVIDAPVERVWSTVMDPARLGEWVTTHESVEADGDGPVAEGDRFRQRLRLAGRSFEVEWRVVEARAPRLARWHGDGPRGSSAEVSYRLEPVDDGTRFDYANSYAAPGGLLGRLAGAALATAPARREARRSLENLRALLEG